MMRKTVLKFMLLVLSHACRAFRVLPGLFLHGQLSKKERVQKIADSASFRWVVINGSWSSLALHAY